MKNLMRSFARTNLVAVTRLIFGNKGIKRWEISDRLQLAPGSVGKYVDQLLEAGVVLELDSDRTRHVGLGMNPKWKKVLGIEVGGWRTRLCHVSGDGTMKEAGFFQTPMDPAKGREAILPYIRGVDGIGLAPTAVVDPHQKSIRLFANRRGWDGLRLEDWDLKKPIDLLTSGQASAMAEKEFGSLTPYTDAIHGSFGLGIQAGIYSHGRLITGASSSAGELGHVFAAESGGKCTCGNHGCLENVGTLDIILYHLRTRLKDGKLSGALVEMARPGKGEVDAPTIRKAWLNGDMEVRTAISEAARHIATALSGVVNMMNPQAITMGGMLIGFFPEIVDAVRNDLETKVLPMNRQTFQLLPAKFPEWGGAYGAGLSSLQRMIDEIGLTSS